MSIDPSIGTERARDIFDAELAGIRTGDGLQGLRNRWVARNGSWIAAFMEQLAAAPPAEKKALGRGANELKKHVEAAIAGRAAELALSRRPEGAVDITLPGRSREPGCRHPLSLVRDEVAAIFERLGYQVLEGPEIEDDYHNFEALNMPAEHPARDMQDTLYLERPIRPASAEPRSAPRGSASARHAPTGAAPTRGRTPLAPQPLTLLRTHTSAMQIRHMERHDPPVRLVAIGPVYRRDNLDLTHTPMFHQVEGLVVGRGITLADLKGTLTSMAAALFGPSTPGDDDGRSGHAFTPADGDGRSGHAPSVVRFRPSFFPYTEPSAEVDIRCIRCNGTGCPMCKRTGWLEILGSGMVHPAVFESVGYDPNQVTGFAFGMGIERVALLKWGVEDIRLFYENDLRFLEQFGR